MPELNSPVEPKQVGLYTPEERLRRDATPWTLVQGILAPIQFLVFLASLGCVLYFLRTGNGLHAANVSVLIKTGVLLLIMVTGSIWEKEVFGVWLFARPFFWEDVFSFMVIALHCWYVIALFTGALEPRQLMYVALAAYGTYVINAGQFIMKLRAARVQEMKMVAANEAARARAHVTPGVLA
jgi:3-vinyl bacteriochlorophyllide hydratase